MSHLPPLAHLPFSPAADRNKQPILDVLLTLLPPTGHALEVASGTGQHAVWFTAALPGWTWQPTDFDADALPGIDARVAHEGTPRVHPARRLDVTTSPWLADAQAGLALFDLVYAANMLHISPWATCAGLVQGAARHLAPGGRLVTYGPYLEDGVPTSPGNLAFDQSLRASDPAWGLRRREDVQAQALQAGLRMTARHAMPANNLLLVFERG
jgi:SAM-dependent methyltransferase